MNAKRRIIRNCKDFLSGHGPKSPKDRFKEIQSALTDYERADFYGHGMLIEKFEKKIAKVLGKPAAVFMPTGTMAQLIAAKIRTDQKNNSLIAISHTSHLELH